MDRKNLIIIGIVILIGVSTTLFAYQHAKNSYRAVGFNDGTIMQKYVIIDNLNKIQKLEQCPSSPDGLIEFISVKNTNLYVIKTKDNSLNFCILE